MVAPIGPAVFLGAAMAGPGSATLTLATIADSAAGNAILAFAAWDGNATTVSFGPGSGGNVYAIGGEVPANQGRMNGYTCLGATYLPAGGTIPLTLSKSNNNKMLLAWSIPGVVALDQETDNGAGDSTGNGDQPSINTGSLAQLGNELALAATWEDLGATDVGYQEDPNYSAGVAALQVGALRSAWRLPVASRAAIYYNPRFGVANNWGGKIFVLRGEAPLVPGRYIASRFRGVGIAAAPRPKIFWGYQADTSGSEPWIAAAHNLGAATLRTGVNPTDPITTGSYARLRDQCLAANPPIALVLNFKYRPPGHPPNQSIPATDIPAYQAQIAAFIDLHEQAIVPANGGLITFENEVNGAGDAADFQTQGTIPPPLAQGGDYGAYDAACLACATATYGAYRTMLLAGVDVCHSTGAYSPTSPARLDLKVNGQPRARYPCADCGMSSTGFGWLRWDYLWRSGDYASADRYLGLISGGTSLPADMPNSASPGTLLFADNPLALINLHISRLILAGAATTGQDDLNLHLFSRRPDIGAQIEAVTWAKAATGLPIAMTACGQKDTNPLTSAALTNLGVAAGASYFSLFGASHSLRSYSFTDPLTGALNDRGTAAAQVIAAHS